MYNSLIVSKIPVEVQGIYGESMHMNVDPDCTIGEIRDYLSQSSNTYVDEMITHNGVSISDNARVINYYPRIFKLYPKQKVVLRDAEDYIASEGKQDVSQYNSYKSQPSHSRRDQELQQPYFERECHQCQQQPFKANNEESVLYNCEEDTAKVNELEENQYNNCNANVNVKTEIKKDGVDELNVMPSNVQAQTKTLSKDNLEKRREKAEHDQKLKTFKKRSVNNAAKPFSQRQNVLERKANTKRRESTSSKSSREENTRNAINAEGNELPAEKETEPSENMQYCESLPVFCIKITCKVPSQGLTEVIEVSTNENFNDVLTKLHERQPNVNIDNAKIVYKDKVYTKENKDTLFNLGIRADAIISVATETFSDPSMCILLDLENEYAQISDEITHESTEKSRKEAYEKLMKILLRTDALQSLNGEWKERRKCLVKELTKLQDSLSVEEIEECSRK